MNPNDAPDPQIELFELQLTALAPRLSLAEQQRMLYECAFSAGRRQSHDALLRSRVATTVLGLLVFGMSFPMAYDRLAAQSVKSKPMLAVEDTPPASLAPVESPVTVRKSISVRLDAWQIPASIEDPWDRKTVQLPTRDPSASELTVGQWQRGQLF